MIRAAPKSVDLLILGAGWTSTFLIPLCNTTGTTFAATTTTGRSNTIPFKFDPSSDDDSSYKLLPSAKTVLITFPLTGHGQSNHLTSMYRSCHGEKNNWVQLGSTGIFKGEHWVDNEAPYDKSSGRAIAEDELRSCVDGCVLNLAGLYGGTRQPRNWVTRVATTKEQVEAKNALHLVHGDDVARAILAVHTHFTPGKRWLVTDMHVYDWWDLIQDWSDEVQELAKEAMGEEAAKLEYRRWVAELMVEKDIKALPRSAESLGRVLDSRNFWCTVGAWPGKGRVH